MGMAGPESIGYTQLKSGNDGETGHMLPGKCFHPPECGTYFYYYY